MKNVKNIQIQISYQPSSLYSSINTGLISFVKNSDTNFRGKG